MIPSFISEAVIRLTELVSCKTICRIHAADEWDDDLNPTQWTALSYLARTNRFSRSPSQVSDFMTATRGTVSQTLKALARKDLIKEIRSEHDKRSISYSVTPKGNARLLKTSAMDDAVSLLSNAESNLLLTGLETLVRKTLQQKGLRPFGVCGTCEHYRNRTKGGFCSLLNEPLTAAETDQICHEHREAA